MRKCNTIVSLLMVFLFVIHIIMGSTVLLSWGTNAGKIFIRAGVTILLIHLITGIILTVKTFSVRNKNQKNYVRENSSFWIRRISGIAILIFMCFHFGVFGKTVNGIYVPSVFTTAKLITQLLMITALFVHLFTNVRPLLMSCGIVTKTSTRKILYIITGIIFAFVASAFVFYYVGWLVK